MTHFILRCLVTIAFVFFMAAFLAPYFAWRLFLKLCAWRRWLFACSIRDRHALGGYVFLSRKAYKVGCEVCGRTFLGFSNLSAPMDLTPWTQEIEREFARKGDE